MIAGRMREGDAVGIICPSHIAGEDYKQIVKGIEQLGFRVNLGANLRNAKQRDD